MHYQTLAGALLSGLALISQAVATPHYKRADSTTTLGTETVPISTSIPTATLLPAVHWDRDVTKLRHLHPKKHARLFYSENGLGRKLSAIHDPMYTTNLCDFQIRIFKHILHPCYLILPIRPYLLSTPHISRVFVVVQTI